MYNKELKMKFIENYTTSEGTAELCVKIFEAFERYEREWGADLCTKSADELQPSIDSLAGLRVQSQRAYLTILREYVRWCIRTGVTDACDGILQIKTVGLEKMKRQTVSSPLHLQMYLNIICDPESEQTLDNTFRCYYWLAYIGIDEDDVLSIKASDVDLSNMVVHYNNDDIKIPTESLDAFKNCANLKQFVYKHPNYGKQIYRDRVDGDTLLRGIKGNPTLKSFRNFISRRSRGKFNDGSTTLQLSYLRVQLSGLFFRTYEMERAGIPVSFTDAAVRFMEGKTYDSLHYGRNKPEAMQRKIEKEYLADYERWKLAYSI